MPRRTNFSLKRARRRLGLTQHDLAFLIGDRGEWRINRFERGRRVLPPLEVALAMEAVLGTPVSALFNETSGAARTLVREQAGRLRELSNTSRSAARATRRQRSLDDLSRA